MILADGNGESTTEIETPGGGADSFGYTGVPVQLWQVPRSCKRRIGQEHRIRCFAMLQLQLPQRNLCH